MIMIIFQAIIILSASAMLLSCTQERSCRCSGNQWENNLKCVTFVGEIPLTKGAKQTYTNYKSSIYTYYAGNDPTKKKALFDTPYYTTLDLDGKLTPINGQSLFLTSGYYDFYSIALNRDTKMDFNNGLSHPLSNGVDYLWSCVKDESIVVNKEILFYYKHSSCSLRVGIITDRGDSLLKIDSVLITLPEPGGRMSLVTGLISPSNKTGSEVFVYKQSYPEDYSTYITGTVMLPALDNVKLPLKVHLSGLNGDSNVNRKVVKGEIWPPQGGFKGGKIYSYTAIITLESVSFSGAIIEDWQKERYEIDI